MTPDVFIDIALAPALRLLPLGMDSPEARAMVISIVLQESRLTYRKQKAGGPARGYAQFEKAGIRGVLTHAASAAPAQEICTALDIQPTVASVYAAIQYSDVLMCAFARLLLWTDPRPLPTQDEGAIGWAIYVDCWKPGTPRRATWNTNYLAAWRLVRGQSAVH